MQIAVINGRNETTNDMEEKKINQMSLANCDLDEVEIVLGDRFELKIEDDKYYAVRKKPTYADENLFQSTIDHSEIDKQCFDEVNKRYSEITHVCLTGHGYTLPDGYHFTDENGNVIGAKKIKLVKNAPRYPKTYDECLDVLSMDYATHYNLKYFTYERGFYEYATTDKLCSLQDKLNILGKLIICRNAYWKIAGEELGLGKPWEPDFSDDSPKYNIFRYENEITLSDNNWSNRILVFPTIEMRDAFYNNFKFLIELCKELL